MKHPLKHRLALLFGLIATGIEASDAAEWTTTLDRHAAVADATLIDGALAATDEALWIGPQHAFDPVTGADLPSFALPERFSLVDRQYGTSSQRGRLWKSYFFFDFMPYYQPDAVEGFWGMAGTGATEAVYLAKDGAQQQRWTGANFGRPEMHVIAVNPLLERAGAMVLIGDTGAALALQVDPHGKIVRATGVPACGNAIADDRHDGLYVLCPAIGANPGELHHLGASASERWSRPVRAARLSRSGVGADGSVLATESTQGSAQPVFQSIDRLGNLQFRASADQAVVVDDGAWLQSQERLMHYGRNGQLLASASMPGVQDFAAHPDGTVVAWRWQDVRQIEKAYRFIASDGTILRELSSAEPATRVSSILSVEPGSTVPTTREGHRDVLIGDDGQPTSAAVPRGPAGLKEIAMADALTICKSGDYQDIVPLPYTHCFDRTTGRALTDTGSFGNGQLTWVDGHVVLDDGFVYMSREGLPLKRISTAEVIAHDFHPTRGLAVLRRDQGQPGTKVLERYRADGSLLFATSVPFMPGEAIVGVGSDGSTIVSGKQSPTPLLRYDAEGHLRVMRTLELSKPGLPVVAVSSSSAGALLLQRAEDGESRAIGQVTVLDAQLVRRGEHPFSGVASALFQPARDGLARFVQTTPSALVVQQFDPATGQPSERRALPIQDTDGRFAIDLDGVVRAMSFDAALGRDVLRISRPAPNPFAGPIGQSALAGAWFNPASNGQGLLLQLLNGNVLFGAWHTFAPEGGNALSKQRWFTVSAELSNERGRITLPIYRNANGRFDTDGSTPAQAVGSAELVFAGCDHLEFWYRIGDEAGVFPLQRLTPRTQACDDGTTTQPALDAPKGLAIDGAWLDPDQSGQGFTFNATGARFGSFLAGWFTYDTDGSVDDDAAQHWFTLQGQTPAEYGQSVPVLIHRTTGGSRTGTPTKNSHSVGSALLTLQDCAHATLDYAFDDSAVAGPFANRARRVQLLRLGACPQ